MDDEAFLINYSAITEENSLLPLTRRLASDVQKSMYFATGDFIKSILDEELEDLMYIAEVGDDHHNFTDLMLISGMLSLAEGTYCSTVKDFSRATEMLSLFLKCELLHRRGLIKVYHENMSFGEDMLDKIIAENIDD